MEMQNLNVKYANHTKILKLDPFMLYVRVQRLDDPEKTINCLVVKHALTLYYQLQADAQLALYGHYNQRHQFVINKFMVGQPTKILAS
ncbi:hypothetical protein RA086_03865 [Lactiplantibacillus sp. WILCCON 0030]|uniref:Uncharacterized protein n=1 Tax=Lactiplantibacillus brownii TaxID=3069269 RepID=A0ABU1A8L3_9LACO|nr:hypothetical protein [Lactiplantibacillus brownii]MDQ7936783.1 hypothetical protein [Lactiplantibacillus brownii]